MKISVNFEIGLTHILARKRQTLVAAFGVTIGVMVFVFMNSLLLGFNRFFDESVFKSIPHIRIYKEDEISKPLVSRVADKTSVVVNPKISNLSKNLIDPASLISAVKKLDYVVTAAQWVTVNLFYANGKSQLPGVSSGANIMEANSMFDIQSTIVDGDVKNLRGVANGLIIGAGIAEKLNIRINENLTVISSFGITKVMKVVGIFETNNSITDKSKSYMNLAAAQQLMGEGPSYVTDIFVNIKDPNITEKFTSELEKISGYKVEDWKTANETFYAAGKMRTVMMRVISSAILLVAAFGIYNILNMTIMQKLNDIAILKATGFSGTDVIKIFVAEAFIMGFLGTCAGLVLASFLVKLLSHVYIGGDIGYFPIRFEPTVFIIGAFIGIFITLCAGFIPARNAAKVDPIEIFRR